VVLPVPSEVQTVPLVLEGFMAETVIAIVKGAFEVVDADNSEYKEEYQIEADEAEVDLFSNNR
jgi:hypothetical protein